MNKIFILVFYLISPSVQSQKANECGYLKDKVYKNRDRSVHGKSIYRWHPR